MLPFVGYRQRYNPLSRRDRNLPLTSRDLQVALDYVLRQAFKATGLNKRKAMAGGTALVAAGTGALNYARKRLKGESQSNGQHNIKNKSVTQAQAMVKGNGGKKKKTNNKRKRKNVGSTHTRNMLRKLIDRRIKRASTVSYSKPMYYMNFDTGNLTSPINGSSVYQFHILDDTFVTAAIDQTSPTINGITQTWRDLSTSNVKNKIHFFRGTIKLELCNNYNYGVKLLYWIVKCTDHSDVAPLNHTQIDMDTTYYAEAKVPTAESTMEVRQFNEFELTSMIRRNKGSKLLYRNKKIILPGQTSNILVKIPYNVLDLSGANVFGQQYIKGTTYSLLISMRAQVSHDANGSALVGWADGKLDYAITRRVGYKIQHSDEQEARIYSSNLDVVVNPNVVTMDIEEKTDVEG